MTLRGYKEIAKALKSIWGIDVSVQSLWKWSHAKVDPLPIKRIRAPGASRARAMVSADSIAVAAWARRRIA